MGRRATGTAFTGAGALLEPGTLQSLQLAWRLLRDPRVAPRLKLVAPIIAALYVVSPIDLVPDLLLGLGQLDDLGVLAVLLVVLSRLMPRLAPEYVLREHKRAMGTDTIGEDRGPERAQEHIVDAPYTVRR